MASENPLDILSKIPPKVIEDAYSDGVKGTLQVASSIGVDALKTIQLALFPFQFASAFQDRLASYIDRAIRNVPEERRVTPVESFVLQIADRLRLQEEGVVATMFTNLLSRAMDRERVGEAHPAFIQIITQIAPDEAILLQQFSEFDPMAYMRKGQKPNYVIAREERDYLVNKSELSENLKSYLRKAFLQPEGLGQPDLLYTYIEHLRCLGLVDYTNNNAPEFGRQEFGDYKYWFVHLNEFGKLFHSACIG